MKGKEAIVEKIVSDARAIANSTLEEASACGRSTIAAAENDARIYREKNMRESYEERDEIIRRKTTVANLEVKKLVLAKKQQVISQAFSEAVRLIKADRQGYFDILKGMISKADDGDKIFFSVSDADIVDEKWLLDAAKEQKKDVTFGGYGSFVGGMVAEGGDSDKNMTLEVELQAIRESYEATIADILFGE